MWVQQILGPKNVQVKKSTETNFGPKILCPKILGQKNQVQISLVLAEICQYTETRIKDAGTNVAWSNVS